MGASKRLGERIVAFIAKLDAAGWTWTRANRIDVDRLDVTPFRFVPPFVLGLAFAIASAIELCHGLVLAGIAFHTTVEAVGRTRAYTYDKDLESNVRFKNASDAITITINNRPVSTAPMPVVRNPVFSLSEGTQERGHRSKFGI